MPKLLTVSYFNLEATRRLFLVGLLLFALAHVAQHDLFFANSNDVDCEYCHLEHFPQVLPTPVIILSFPVLLTISDSYLTIVYRRFEFGNGSIRSPPVL